MRIWTRYSAAGKRVIVVVQRGLLLLVDGLVDLVQVEGHLVDVRQVKEAKARLGKE